MSNQYCMEIAQKAKKASQELAKASPKTKNLLFTKLAALLEEKESFLLQENAKDLAQAYANKLDTPRIDRLKLTKSIIKEMAEACLHMTKLDDPIGSMEKSILRPNGLQVSKMRIPLGVICMIYEARPNVTVDASILCLKASNAVILRGGSEAIYSNIALEKLILEALEFAQLPAACVQLLHQTERKYITELCQLNQYIDVIIPRGGTELVHLVSQEAKMPVLKHDKGVCHAYIDQSANLEEAVLIVQNSKTQRPAACNALEAVLVHHKISKDFITLLEKTLQGQVEFRACPKTQKYLQKFTALQDSDQGQEFHDFILVTLEVQNLDEALDYISKYGSNHTEIICTNDYAQASRFVREVDASMVAINASSRFNDGGQLGLGAEIGISTSKIHAYGVMGINELTSTKFVVSGNGQIRE